MSQGEAHRHNHRQHTLGSLLTHLHLRRSRKNPLIVEEGAPRTFFDSAKAGIINNIIIRGPAKSLLTAKIWRKHWSRAWSGARLPSLQLKRYDAAVINTVAFPNVNMAGTQ
jgi:hypothetical protein